MKKSILIIGAGQGLSLGIARRFAEEEFTISLISRNARNLETIKSTLEKEGINVAYAVADAADAEALNNAITTLSKQVSGFDVVLYNAAVLKAKDILDETSAELVHDYTVNVANAVQSLQSTYSGLKEKHGAFLLTGGGFGITPMAAYGSLSIGKAGLRSLAYQLHDRLKAEGIYVGLLTVAGLINPNSKTHSPAILADLFWKLYSERQETEIHQ